MYTTWIKSRAHATRTLHLTHEDSRRSVQIDLSSGHAVADLPATKPISNANILVYILFTFFAEAQASSMASASDLLVLSHWVAERLYTNARVDALECSIRRILYEADANEAGLCLADLVRSRAEFILQGETVRYSAKHSGSSGGSSGGSSRAGKGTPGGQQSKPKLSGDFCYNWTRGEACAPSSKRNGVCRFPHVCGKPLPGGGVCREKHKQADCSH